MAQRQEFTIFADYFQFYIQDEHATGDLSESWTQDAVDRLLAIAPGCVGVGTVRNMDVPVTVEIAEAAPNEDLNQWDHVNECSIDVPRVRICYGNLKTISANGLEGSDHYRVFLWPAPPGPPTILKQRTKPDIAQ